MKVLNLNERPLFNFFQFFIAGTFILKLLETTVSFIPPIYKYYLPISLVISAFYILLRVKFIRGYTSIYLFYCSFFSYLFILANVILSERIDLNGTTSLEQHIVLLISIPAFFLYGISTSFIVQPSRLLTKSDYMFFLALCIVILINVNFNFFRLDFESFKYDKAVYLFLGDLLAMIGIYFFSFSKGKLNKLLYFSSFICLLFFVYSRTSLYFFIFSILFVLFVCSNKKAKLVFLIFSVFISVLIVNSAHFLKDLNLSYSINRMLFIFSGTEDGSLNGRELIFTESVKRLESSILFGNFGDQIEVFGYWTFYIHNIVSYFRQFGIITFLLVLSILVLPFFYFLKKLLYDSREQRSSVHVFGFTMVVYFLCIYIFSRSYLYAYAYFIPGFLIGIIYNEKDSAITDR
tara:strand:- start:1938 stop:3152 length:1215 start_codon:yes stop_codon:yes gene_type:complete